MKKALMYLLLALGISLGVLFIGGAVLGFTAGFIDGMNGDEPGTTSTMGLMTWGGVLMLVVACIILQWVFLHLKLASYAEGVIPKPVRWKILLWLMLALGGMGLFYCVIYNPMLPDDGSLLSASDDTNRKLYEFLKESPILSICLIVIVEATADLVIYGGILRELLEWKHNPHIIIPVYALLMGLFSVLGGNGLLALNTLLITLIEGYAYERCRSVIPVILADIFYWLVIVSLVGTVLPGWLSILSAILTAPACYLAYQATEPYKPID